MKKFTSHILHGKILFIALLFIAGCDSPLKLQDLDYTEDPIDIPNPDRGAYRGR